MFENEEDDIKYFYGDFIFESKDKFRKLMMDELNFCVSYSILVRVELPPGGGGYRMLVLK